MFTRWMARTPRPPPMAMRGASGPRTAPRHKVAREQTTMPGRLIGSLPPPVWNPSAGLWPPVPGRYVTARATIRPPTRRGAIGHQAGALLKPSSWGASRRRRSAPGRRSAGRSRRRRRSALRSAPRGRVAARSLDPGVGRRVRRSAGGRCRRSRSFGLAHEPGPPMPASRAAPGPLRSCQLTALPLEVRGRRRRTVAARSCFSHDVAGIAATVDGNAVSDLRVRGCDRRAGASTVSVVVEQQVEAERRLGRGGVAHRSGAVPAGRRPLERQVIGGTPEQSPPGSQVRITGVEMLTPVADRSRSAAVPVDGHGLGDLRVVFEPRPRRGAGGKYDEALRGGVGDGRLDQPPAETPPPDRLGHPGVHNSRVAPRRR